MAYKWVIAILGCICLGLSIAFVCVQISRQSMAVSIEELKAENARLNRERVDALGEVEFLRSAIRRFDAALAEASQAVAEIEEDYHARTKQIHDLPADWLSCPLPDGVCDMFAGYTLPRSVTSPDSTTAAVSATGGARNADE